MSRRKEIMGYMVVGLMVIIGYIEMTRLEMASFWTIGIGEVMDTGIILVLVRTCIMIFIFIILTEGVIGDIF